MKSLTISRFPELDYACTEALNTLCTNLSFCGSDNHVVMFTSRYEQEGKSSIAMNVMRTLAGFGKKVLLIDADLRRSSLARRFRFVFDMKKSQGLAQYLAGMCPLTEVIYETDIPNAYILPAGRDVINSMQLLASSRFGEIFELIKDVYDMIIIDTPPAGVIVDAIEIARHCDGAVLVVGYNTGNGRDLGEVVANITKTGCPVLGAVLNGVDLNTFRNRRYYRSGYYHSYYKVYGDKAEKIEPVDTSAKPPKSAESGKTAKPTKGTKVPKDK